MVADPDDPTGPMVPELTRAKQEFAKECDIHVILAQYRGGQPISHLNSRQATYGDFSTAPDYMEALHAVQAAEDDFMALPATTRARFENNPANLLRFTSDPENQQEAYDLGLAEKPDEDPAIPSPPQPPEPVVETPTEPAVPAGTS